MKNEYRICTRCVMDTTAAGIVFDKDGVCNYCTEFMERSSSVIFQSHDSRKEELENLAARIKEDGRKKPYDCIVGVSGGVDSSWALVKAMELGLRPLAVHMDNGWNSELAKSNIHNLVSGLGVDLYTHTIENDEYVGLLKAFLDADVIDIELLYDNAMLAVNYRQAAKHKVKWILAGTNQATEGIRVPSNWNWIKYDAKNIKAIGRELGGVRLKSFPALGMASLIANRFLRGIRWTSILDYTEFNKYHAVEALKREYAYVPYPYKHYESVLTRFYQGFILPQKFGVDKRKLHLSTLVISGQMSRPEALNLLEGDPYPSLDELEQDRRCFMERIGWSEEQLADYLNRPEKSHDSYPSVKRMWTNCSRVNKFLFRSRLL